MHYGITLWAYLSESLVKHNHKHLSSTKKYGRPFDSKFDMAVFDTFDKLFDTLDKPFDTFDKPFDAFDKSFDTFDKPFDAFDKSFDESF